MNGDSEPALDPNVSTQQDIQSIELERIIVRFEAAWKTGQRPEIADFLPHENPLRQAVLRELIHTDLELRVKSGEIEADPAGYLSKFPELNSENSLLQSLMVRRASLFAREPRGLPPAKRIEDENWLALTPGTVLGNYTIVELIGRGGMGAVFRAHHSLMKRDVALKTISPAALRSPESVRRFHKEVQALARLDHPHIVTAHDAHQFGDLHVLVMQYVEGQDLAKVVQNNGTLEVSVAVRLIIEAAQGLRYAHESGIIHRDIKPANLVIDGQGRLKILDLGLARMKESLAEATPEGVDVLTQTGNVLGTVDFMAPEQAYDGKLADARSDIYSLGCTLYYLLSGKRLFEGQTVVQRLLAHREAAIPRLRDACAEVPEWLESCFGRMVAKNPKDRFQSMADLLAASAQKQGELPDFLQKIKDTADALANMLDEARGGRPGPAGSKAPVGKRLAEKPRKLTTAFKVVNQDITHIPADLLLLKHAAGFHGADLLIKDMLTGAGLCTEEQLTIQPNQYVEVDTHGKLSASRVLFLGTPYLDEFNYPQMRHFARSAIEVIGRQGWKVERLTTTVHGVGYGLDAEAALLSLVKGFEEGLRANDHLSIREIVFVEMYARRAELLATALKKNRGEYTTGTKRVFVAMPVSDEFEDVYEYGIYGPVRNCGLICEKSVAGGLATDAIEGTKDRIAAADLLISEVTGARPDVYLEVGYAWGKNIPVIYLARQGEQLHFDPGPHPCIFYKNIRHLASELESVIRNLVSQDPD